VNINGRVVNFETFEVILDGAAIRLTAMEIKLLRYFCENEDRVIPRHELLEEVWDQPGRIQTRAPDQFMRRLRKLFENDPARPRHFVTVRDAGYRFIHLPG
jgi:two-component system OmpR family response regulator